MEGAALNLPPRRPRTRTAGVRSSRPPPCLWSTLMWGRFASATLSATLTSEAGAGWEVGGLLSAGEGCGRSLVLWVCPPPPLRAT